MYNQKEKTYTVQYICRKSRRGSERERERGKKKCDKENEEEIESHGVMGNKW